LTHLGAGEALVVAQIEVGLGAIFSHEDFPVLEGAHRAGVDVDVGVELEVGNLDAAGFKNRPEGGGSDAFAQRGHDTTGNKDVFGHDTGDFWKGE
jgi:hypothetical protein